MVERFDERAPDSGLEVIAHKGLYKYQDRYSEVVYRNLISFPHNAALSEGHDTDSYMVPMLAIFTKAPDSTSYKYVGYISDLYKFIGNDVLNQLIRESILSIGMPILRENTIMSGDLTIMRNEIIMQNGQTVANVGDVLPVMIVNNSYNGKRAASISFGIAFNHNSDVVTFAFQMGEIRQVHISNSTTSMTSAMNTYVQLFNTSITEIITQSFQSRLTEQEMLGVLDIVEGIGKKKREAVSALLSEIQGSSQSGLPTAWQMFLAIVRYSSLEPNLNVKRLLENAAESVLVIPVRMFEVLERLRA